MPTYRHRPKKLKHHTFFSDKMMLIVGIIGPFMTIPQAMDIWIGHKVDGVSLLSWSAYTVLAVIWLAYGLTHKEKPIIVANFLYILVNSIIVSGVILLKT